MENQVNYSSNINIDEISQKLASKCVDAIENGVKPLSELNDFYINQVENMPLSVSIPLSVAYNRLVRRLNTAINRYKEDIVALPKSSFNVYHNNNGVQNV